MRIIRVDVNIPKSVFRMYGMDRHDQVQWQGKYPHQQWLDAISRKLRQETRSVWKLVHPSTIGLGSLSGGVIASS